LLVAGSLVPYVLHWRDELAKISTASRHVVWVHGNFIALTVLGFSALSIIHADTLAAGSPLARSLCGFIALFWLTRLGIQLFVFDLDTLTNQPLLRIGYHCLTLVFVYLSVVYTLAALNRGG
jgi:hypothetical protein